MMSLASMVDDYYQFRKKHTTKALFIIGKKDELFDWKKTPGILGRHENIKYIFLPEAAHLDIFVNGGADKIKEWLNNSTF